MNIDETIEQNIGLVNNMASKLYVKNSVYCLEDLIQVGLLNLVTALPKYDPDRAKLSTFISYCVKNSMIKFIKKNHDTSKINTPKFESLPINDLQEQTNKSYQNKFFYGDVVYGNNLYYYEDEDIQNYIKDHDEITKKIVMMKIAGKTQKHIKKELNISENEIRSILKKIKNELIESA